jgi:hypothetical protein
MIARVGKNTGAEQNEEGMEIKAEAYMLLCTVTVKTCAQLCNLLQVVSVKEGCMLHALADHFA